MEYQSTNPGDILIVFSVIGTSQTDKQTFTIPIKTLTVNNPVNITHEYHTGLHEPAAQIQGSMDHKGNFKIGSWLCDDGANPKTWDTLLRKYLIYQSDQGLRKEFDIEIQGREGDSYQSQEKGPVKCESGVAEIFRRCLITDDGTDVPEKDGSIVRSYEFTFFRREFPLAAGE